MHASLPVSLVDPLDYGAIFIAGLHLHDTSHADTVPMVYAMMKWRWFTVSSASAPCALQDVPP